MSHPFGNLVSQYLARKNGLTKSKLAKGVHYDPSLITRMCKGERLIGLQARERVLAIVRWFLQEHVLNNIQEADALLNAAGMAGLKEENVEEFAILQHLQDREEMPPQVQPPRQVLLQGGNLPLHPGLIVGREEALRDLLARLKHTCNDQSSRIQVLTTVQGWPGVGKTTLAATLAHAPDIATAFPDGVLWTSLGQTPNILAELAVWGRALGVDQLSLARSVEEAAMQLAAFLRDKRMLLIVDDAWKTEHATPFRVGGHNCALLVTTRLPSVAQDLAATPDDIYKLPVLTDYNALKLLKTLAPTVEAQYPQECLELVRELEGLPLALQVAGRLLNREASLGWGITQLLDELRAGARLLEANVPAELADLASETTPTVATLLKKSTDHLNQQTRECFALLGAFAPKPASFSLAALRSVWKIRNPKPLVDLLADRGLLEPAGSGRFQMHALLVLHARSLLPE